MSYCKKKEQRAKKKDETQFQKFENMDSSYGSSF